MLIEFSKEELEVSAAIEELKQIVQSDIKSATGESVDRLARKPSQRTIELYDQAITEIENETRLADEQDEEENSN